MATKHSAVLLFTLSLYCNAIQRKNGITLQDGNNYGDDPHHGRVELCNNGYGTLCDDSTTDTANLNAICNVLCIQLGYTKCDGINDASYAPSGTGNIWLNNIECEGIETKITDCIHNIIDTNDTCSHDQDITIQCSDYIAGCEGGFISTECIITSEPTMKKGSYIPFSNDMKPTTKRPTNNPTPRPVCIVPTPNPTADTSHPSAAPTDVPIAITDIPIATNWWIPSFNSKYWLICALMIVCLCCCLCLNCLLLAKPKKKKKGHVSIVYGERHGGTLCADEVLSENEGEIQRQITPNSFETNMKNIVGVNQLLLEDVIENVEEEKAFGVNTNVKQRIELDDGSSSDEVENLYNNNNVDDVVTKATPIHYVSESESVEDVDNNNNNTTSSGFIN